MDTKYNISEYCKKCLKFKRKRCKGKSPNVREALGSWGISSHQLGALEFCKHYDGGIGIFKPYK